MLAGKFGGKSLILCSMLSNGVVNLFVPLAASKVRSLCFIVIFIININKYFHCGRGTWQFKENIIIIIINSLYVCYGWREREREKFTSENEIIRA